MTTHEVLKEQPADALLRLFAETLEELRIRGLIRSSNNPAGDYAEKISVRALGLELTGKSKSGYDALDADGHRYQIKGRRITLHNKSRQLSAIRNLESTPFDWLIGILFNAQFEVQRACMIPCEIVKKWAAFSKHVNGHRFLLRDDVWDIPDVTDVTARIAAAAKEICQEARGG